MVKRVVITNYLGESVEYKIEGVDVFANNGLLITEIEGLGPTGADVIFTKLVSIDGSLYNSSRINERNIVINARFTWANTIEEARIASYKLFPLKKILRFEIETDTRRAFTYGYVEKNEPNIFSSECDMQVSVMCESPFFQDANGETEEMFSNVVPCFEFVYENEGLDFNTEMSYYEPRHNSMVIYHGETDIGFSLVLHAIGPVTNPAIYFLATGASIAIDSEKLKTLTGKYFDEGDDIIITSLPGRKTVYLLRDGTLTNILNIMDKDLKWPTLSPGPNYFSYIADYGEEYLRCYVRYQALYEGV